MYGTGLIPARFLIWVFHLILTIIVLMARVSNLHMVYGNVVCIFA